MTKDLTAQIDLENKLIDLVRDKRLVILFVGNPSRGDDGAPHLLFNNFRRKAVKIKLRDCGTSPQDCIEEAVKLEPDIVIFVNAVDRSLPPGTVVLEEFQVTDSCPPSLVSHKFPLALIAALIEMTSQRQDRPIRVFLIGIQVRSTEGHVTITSRKSMNWLLRVFKKMDSDVASFT